MQEWNTDLEEKKIGFYTWNDTWFGGFLFHFFFFLILRIQFS